VPEGFGLDRAEGEVAGFLEEGLLVGWDATGGSLAGKIELSAGAAGGWASHHARSTIAKPTIAVTVSLGLTLRQLIISAWPLSHCSVCRTASRLNGWGSARNSTPLAR
jgi:hypothetical protein